MTKYKTENTRDYCYSPYLGSDGVFNANNTDTSQVTDDTVFIVPVRL